MLYIPMQVRFDKSKLNKVVSAKSFKHEPKTTVGNSEWLNLAQMAAMQCLPQQQYGGCVPPGVQLPPPPAPNPCNAGNLGKITYVTLALTSAISAAAPWTAGTTRTWLVRPDTGFKGEKIIIPSAVFGAANLATVDSVEVQNDEQLSTPPIVGGQGVNVSIFFSSTLSDGLGRLSMQNCPPNSPIKIVLFLVTGPDIVTPFSIDLLGIAS